jgi:hypothetical protein
MAGLAGNVNLSVPDAPGAAVPAVSTTSLPSAHKNGPSRPATALNRPSACLCRRARPERFLRPEKAFLAASRNRSQTPDYSGLAPQGRPSEASSPVLTGLPPGRPTETQRPLSPTRGSLQRAARWVSRRGWGRESEGDGAGAHTRRYQSRCGQVDQSRITIRRVRMRTSAATLMSRVRQVQGWPSPNGSRRRRCRK